MAASRIHRRYDLAKWNGEIRKLLDQIEPDDLDTPATARLADLQERIRLTERRATTVREAIVAINRKLVDERDVAKLMGRFDPVWESLTPQEQTRAIQLLVERVDYNGHTGKLAITFHPTGIGRLADEFAGEDKEQVA